jgi:hypothetical protein
MHSVVCLHACRAALNNLSLLSLLCLLSLLPLFQARLHASTVLWLAAVFSRPPALLPACPPANLPACPFCPLPAPLQRAVLLPGH